MALSRVFLKKQFKISNTWSPLISGVRYALYPDTYLTPIPNRQYLDQLESEGKLEAMKAIPVKPAPIDMTNSLYDEPDLKLFINLVMQWSNKNLARQLVFDVLAQIKRIQLAKYHAASDEEKASIVTDPRKVLYTAVENCKPVLTVLPTKKGGIIYQVPIPVTPKMSRFMAMKWLVAAGRDKEGEISFVDQLSRELLDAYNNEGRVVKRKHALHKLCESNKAYAHYRWS